MNLKKRFIYSTQFGKKLYRKATHPATNVAPLSRGEFVFLKSFDLKCGQYNSNLANNVDAKNLTNANAVAFE